MFVNCMEHGMESCQDAHLYMVSPYSSIMSLTFIINLLLALLSITYDNRVNYHTSIKNAGRYTWIVILCLLITWRMEWNHLQMHIYTW